MFLPSVVFDGLRPVVIDGDPALNVVFFLLGKCSLGAPPGMKQQPLVTLLYAKISNLFEVFN